MKGGMMMGQGEWMSIWEGFRDERGLSEGENE